MGEGSRAVVLFGLLSVVMQSPFLLTNTVAAVNYVRERNWPTALRVFLAYPVEAFWRLPLFSHAGVGIAEGLTRGLKEFVITPKNREDVKVLRILQSQKLVLGVSLGTVLPLLVAMLAQPSEINFLIVAALTLPVLTICALFLVPLTEWIRRRLPLRLRLGRGRRRGDRQDSDRPIGRDAA
jgi:uncharacterized membrane protein